MRYEAPLRCQFCGTPIIKKLKAKTPKYCGSCRKKQQDAWKEQLKISRQYKIRR